MGGGGGSGEERRAGVKRQDRGVEGYEEGTGEEQGFTGGDGGFTGLHWKFLLKKCNINSEQYGQEHLTAYLLAVFW